MRHAIAVYLGEALIDEGTHLATMRPSGRVSRLWDARESDNCFARYQIVYNLKLMLDAFLFMSLNVVL